MVRPGEVDWILPPAVRPGDVVGVCALSAPIVPERFASGLARLAPHLALRVPDGLTAARHGHLAGDDRRRADELTALLRDPDVRAIVMARGGYGITRVLPLVDPALLAADPKPLVGFSDATALLAWAALARVRPIHGPVVSQLGDLPDDDVAALVAALTDRRPPGRLPEPLAAPAGTPAVAGPLVPANLKMLAHLVGTPWQLDAAGALVLVEEVGEKPYAIDRDLTQLGHAGVLAGARGAIVGGLVRCRDPNFPDGTAEDAVAERLAAAGLAAWWGAPVGHGARNRAVPFGARAEVDEAGGLTILEAAVA